MKIKISVKLYFFLSVFIILAFNSVEAKKRKPKNKNVSYNEGSDKFYMIFVDNEIKTEHGKAKREDKEEFLDFLVSEINNLIIENKDTYEDQSKLEEIEGISLKKRNENQKEEEEEEKSNKFAYVLSSLEKESIIYSYLSEDVLSLVRKLPNVKSCIPDFDIKIDNSSVNIFKDLKSIWDKPCVRGDTYNYLSLISQGEFNDTDESYDTNYYFPRSAGQGINVFVFDNGFNFRHYEFSNREEREVKCIIYIDKGSVDFRFYEPERCWNGSSDFHGSKTADIIGGLNHGVASKANIYGVELKYDNNGYIPFSTYLFAYSNVQTNYFNDEEENVKKYYYKSVVNLSHTITKFDSSECIDPICIGKFHNKCEIYNENICKNYLHDIIKDMSEKGVVFVASAGNQNKLVDDYYYPCSFDEVICVGAIDNNNMNDIGYSLMNNEITNEEYNNEILLHADNKCMYPRNYRRAYYSNYGEQVNIYAPGTVKVLYDNEFTMTGNSDYYSCVDGTSFAAPIVSGVVATIMSEKPNLKFTSKRMLNYLKDKGIKGIIKDIPVGPNVFINNGKKTKYNYSTQYQNCGKRVENKICSYDSEFYCMTQGCCLKISDENGFI